MTEPIRKKLPSEFWILCVMFFCGVCLVGVLAGIYHLWSYSVPMANGNYELAAESYLGYRGDALYDAALAAYKKEDYMRATKLLNAVSETVNDSSGKLLESKREIAAEIKFLSGNIFFRQNQFQQALRAYEESLRINPDHRYAKYNLELLKQPPLGGDSKGDGKGDGPGDADPKDSKGTGSKSGPPPKGI